MNGALEASRLCNLKCTMCALHSDFIDHSHTDSHPKHFHLDKYQWILEQMEPYKDYLCLAPQFWGEPFMSPYLKDMILYAKQKGIWLGFTTNGTLWDDKADPGNQVPYTSPSAASIRTNPDTILRWA